MRIGASRVRATVVFSLICIPACLAFGVRTTEATSSYQCQHPVTTGVEVRHLHKISVRLACKVALALQRYEVSGHLVVDCGPNGDTPVLVLRQFEGYKLSLKPEFHLSKGQRSFSTGGTDFPAPCG